MPNWASNHITIRGSNQREIAEIAEAMNQGRFLGSVIPVPEDLNREGAASHGGDNADVYEKIREENLAKHGFGNWYDFCVNRWGTKWEVDCQDVEVEDDGLTVSASFDSAWAPPIGIAEELVDRGLQVTLYYYEPGVGYVGKYEDGQDDIYEYGNETSQTVRAVIGDELDDFFGISESMWEYEQENEEELTQWIRDGAEKRELTSDPAATQVR
jgi:hypothetical protein